MTALPPLLDTRGSGPAVYGREALDALWPEMLAVVETARAYTIAHALCDTDGDEWHRLCATLAALDAAIAAALPAGDRAGDPSTATPSRTTHPGQKPHENR